ncbi:hypothetical protein CDD82_1315 [Ophiocordyceps australis]|uniref:E3 ubiquitin protein ligase n=1 Tax=Ophiocordyceps australis TaxID=1399860 RepID=A0A2C5XZK4_9HYPO|nr:hypothetical protein CDD82_1315 [Ophiocordyceps australis]
MEDRKRPAVGGVDDLAPPSKRVAINGSKVKDESLEMREEGWIEAYTKGAIYRQMQEYSRKAMTAESRLEELHKRCVHHDDHLRLIDGWWRQLLEELELIAEQTLSSTVSPTEPPYFSGISFKDLHEFQNHMHEKGKTIKMKAEALLARLAAQRGQLTPDAASLEQKLTGLLASQKEYLLKLDRLQAEKELLSEKLNAATLRYFKAEKKLDRAKSVQVQKLEQQAFANATKPIVASGDNAAEQAETNGASDELLLKFEEVTASAAKQKEQLDAVLADVKILQDENLSLKARKEVMTDEDLIRLDVFKQFKGQSEDLIKRINNLEATNRNLREEAEKLQAERSAFKTQLEADAGQITQELELEMMTKDQDLARVRSARDELLAENTQRKASMEQQRVAIDHMKELDAAKDDHVAALESQLERLKPCEDSNMATPSDEILDLSTDELRQRYKKLLLDFQSINQELPSIEKAYKKMKDLAQKKFLDFAALEEKVAILIAEKSKADQKYFSARKDSDTRNNENRSLRLQNSKSAEIIAQLKEVEAHNRTLLVNLEKQLADLKQSNAVLTMDTNELTALVQETEMEKLKVRVEHAQKDRDNWKSKALSNSSEEEEMLRTFALCTICRNNFKNTALKTCGHLFCNKCVDDRITNRMRKCPTCSKAFDKMDVMAVHH